MIVGESGEEVIVEPVQTSIRPVEEEFIAGRSLNPNFDNSWTGRETAEMIMFGILYRSWNVRKASLSESASRILTSVKSSASK